MHNSKIAASLAAATVALAGCGGSASKTGSSDHKAPASASVAIKGFKFVPATIVVRAGGTIRFVNGDRAEHTATGGFDTGTLRKGQAKTVRLAKAGTFSYRCAFHPFMTGEVIVK